MNQQQSLEGIGPQWLYENDYGNAVRYILGVKGDSLLYCIGINPSTAIPNNLDNTLKSVQRLAIRNGFAGWVMFNVYPQRATNPNNLHGEMDKVIHARNLERISAALKMCKVHHIWAAWGTLITKRDYLAACLNDIYHLATAKGCRWVTAGKESIDGHPHHPLYLRKDEKYRQFDMESYIDRLTHTGF